MIGGLSSPVWGAVAIGFGAAIGALLRWRLAVWLNGVSALLPLGTLTANLLGGYLVGLAVAFFADQTAWSPVWRLFVITGFLGGLTTFSTFSTEVVSQLQAGRLVEAGLAIVAHLAGSLLATVAGLYSYQWLASR